MYLCFINRFLAVSIIRTLGEIMKGPVIGLCKAVNHKSNLVWIRIHYEFKLYSFMQVISHFILLIAFSTCKLIVFAIGHLEDGLVFILNTTYPRSWESLRKCYFLVLWWQKKYHCMVVILQSYPFRMRGGWWCRWPQAAAAEAQPQDQEHL